MAKIYPPPGYYPPPGFHFKVEIVGFASENEMRFSEAGGLSMEVGTEEVPEGGENRFVQKYPVRGKYPDLVLKRGLLVGSEVIDWIDKCINKSDVTPKTIYVKLLNAEHMPLLTWNLVNAYPTKWGVSDFNASNSTVVIESIQFYYQYFTLMST